MKYIFLLTVHCWLSITLLAQTNTIVHYTYDGSGNRASRRTEVLQLGKSLKEARDSTKKEEKVNEEIDNFSIVVYPNPASYEVNIEIDGSIDELNGSLLLIDQGGRLLISQVQISTRNILNLYNYPRGVYFIVLRIGDKQSKYTIIKK